MSRIGRQPIPLPQGVEVTVDGHTVTVKGPKGTLTRTIHPNMRVFVEDGTLRVERPNDERQNRALHGTSRAILANMVQGVTQGYQKNLELVGVGYRAAKNGNTITLSVGFSHPVVIPAEDGIQFDVPNPTHITVSGIDKEQVGEVSAKIRSVRPPEPYKGKGIRYEGEHVRSKVGKTGKR
ncbi:MAG: 50S ribosomal protein L6 [Firmicutes bacterium]|nr:50S ribosomal protein L6 [Bacillota bacterium]